jgi:hypothetical protein
VKRLFAWVAGLAGGLAAYRAMRGRRSVADTGGADARAAELKAKLQEARAVGDDGDAFDSDEVAEGRAEPQDLQARRAQVHEQGRAALDEMRGDGSA